MPGGSARAPSTASRWLINPIIAVYNGPGLRDRGALLADGRTVYFAYGDGRDGRSSAFGARIRVAPPPAPDPTPTPPPDPVAGPLTSDRAHRQAGTAARIGSGVSAVLVRPVSVHHEDRSIVRADGDEAARERDAGAVGRPRRSEVASGRARRASPARSH